MNPPSKHYQKPSSHPTPFSSSLHLHRHVMPAPLPLITLLFSRPSARFQMTRSAITILDYQCPSHTFSFSMHAKAILTLIGGILIHITLGTMYTSSNLTPYVISYLHVAKKHAVLRSFHTSLTHSISIVLSLHGCSLFSRSDKSYNRMEMKVRQ